MAEYIERDYILKLLGVFNDRVHGDYHFMNGIETAKEIVEDAPSADVQPVKHGENIATDYDEVDQFVCSECGIELQNWVRVERDADDGDETHYEYRFNFCPNCGAKMDGET